MRFLDLEETGMEVLIKGSKDRRVCYVTFVEMFSLGLLDPMALSVVRAERGTGGSTLAGERILRAHVQRTRAVLRPKFS